MNKNNPSRFRILSVAIALFFLFSLLLVQFYKIQILEGENWAKQANKQHFLIVKEPFLRGAFYSNPSIKQGHPAFEKPFVIDVPKYHLYVDPGSIKDDFKAEIANQLIHLVRVPAGEQDKFTNQFYRKSRSRKLVMWVEKDLHQTIMDWWIPYAKKNKIPRNGLFFVNDYQRSYPYGKLMGQVLHTIQTFKDEATNQAKPTGGLELYFNSYLKGKQGKRRLMRSPRHALEIGEVIENPENGSDIYLTINAYIQTIAEEELERGVVKCKAKAGWAVILEPHTGEVLALAQYPSFYPPEYQHYFNHPELIEHTKVKAITDANEPGSVFKPFTMALALHCNEILKKRGEKELFSPEEKIATSSGKFPGRSKPISDTSHHSYLNMDMGMQKSSNIYMGRIAERIINRFGNDWFRAQLQSMFGFGLKTGIELPAESIGVLPTPGKLHPNGALEWSLPTPFSIAMGYNIQATSLQVARAYAVLANGGYLVNPTLVKKIVKNSSTLFPTQEVKIIPRVVDEKIVERTVRSMRFVTKPGGTATRGDIAGYTEVGKTSTPKKIVNGAYSEVLYCPTFAGFAPASQAKIVIVVTMDEPEYGYFPGIGKIHNGGNCTAGVFKEIARRSLQYLGVPPDDPYGYPYGDPRYNRDRILWMPETLKLQELYQSWNKK